MEAIKQQFIPIFPNPAEHEKMVLDEVSRILGRIEADIASLKEGQETINKKLDAIEPRLVKTEMSSAVSNKIGAGGWALFLAIVGAVVAYVLKHAPV